MAQQPRRKWVRGGLALVLVLASAGLCVGWNWTDLKVRYAAHRLKTAAADEDRARWANALAASGDAGLAALVEALGAGDPQVRAAAAAALDAYLNGLPEDDPRAPSLCGRLLQAFTASNNEGREAVLGLVPTILKRGGTTRAAECRDAIESGLKMPAVYSRLIAIRAAMHPESGMRGAIVPLLTDAEPEVRRAALFAIGPASSDQPVIDDEELFRWLHDPDEEVRQVCRDALTSRGRTDAEIAFGQRLTNPDVAERLKLLLDLRYDDEVRDAEPWLERLGRDVDPAVRAGAARVASELAADRDLPIPIWVARLADADPNPTVCRIARYYRMQPMKAAEGNVHTVDGP